MLDSSIFEDAVDDLGASIEDREDALIDWFRVTYPERDDDIGPKELLSAAKEYIAFRTKSLKEIGNV